MTTQGSRRQVGGVNQHGLRNHNERVILSMIQREGEIPGSEIARNSGLSPQTVSVILRRLEQDGLTERGAPLRGRVGKPSVPIALAPDGVLSLGLKIGRRSAELALMDFRGTLLTHLTVRYLYPLPKAIFSFLKEGIAEITESLSPDAAKRIVGLGIATPFELWNWHELIGASEEEMAPWRDIDFVASVGAFSDLPVFVQNDATAACRAELVYGRGQEFEDYAYFYVGAFIGGGLVLNDSVYEGRYGNAGAFGPLPVQGPAGAVPLIERASIYVLEDAIADASNDRERTLSEPLNWDAHPRLVEAWLQTASAALAEASLTICAVVDFQAVLIDGAFPPDIRARLAEMTAAHFATLDSRGLQSPVIEAGNAGLNARVLGAASAPVFSQFFLDRNAGLGRL